MYRRLRVYVKPNQDKNSVLMCPSHGHLSPAATAANADAALAASEGAFYRQAHRSDAGTMFFLTFLACFLSLDLGHLIALVVISEIQ